MHFVKSVCTEDQGMTDLTFTTLSTFTSADDRQMDTGGYGVRFRSDKFDITQDRLE
jgi:hypothetical protein